MALRILKNRMRGIGDDEIVIKYLTARESELVQLLFRAGDRIEGISEAIKYEGLGITTTRFIWPNRPDSLDDDVAISYAEWFINLIRELENICILVRPREPKPFRSPERVH